MISTAKNVPTDTPQKHADALKFFEAVGDILITVIHKDGGKPKSKYFGDNHANAVEYCSAQNNCGHNVYYTPNQVQDNFQGDKPSKTDIINARFCHVDVDPPKAQAAFDKTTAIEAIHGLEYEPFAIIDSGNGIQALFKLDGIHQNQNAVERVNRQLIKALDGDRSCFNIDRLLRIPSFMNYATEAKLKAGRTDCASSLILLDTKPSYSVDELAEFLPEPAQTVIGDSHDRDSSERLDCNDYDVLFLEEIGIAKDSDTFKAITEPDGADRSANALGAARLMAMEGKTDEQIAGVLLNEEYDFAGHLLDQPNKFHLDRALTRIIGLVRIDNPEVPQLDIDFSKLVEKMRLKNANDNPDTPASYQVDPELAEQLKGRPDDFVLQWRKRLNWFIFEHGEPALRAVNTAQKMFLVDRTETVVDQFVIPEGVPAWQRDLGDHPFNWFVDHCSRNAMYHQPEIALGSAIAAFGTLAGRRYKSPTGLRTNVYIMGICSSGGGKDVPLRAASDMLINANQPSMAGPAKLASGQALLTEVKTNPSVLLSFDEFGRMLKQVASPKAPPHLAEIIDNLTQLYSASQKTFQGTSYADSVAKPRIVIEQPCASLIGVSTESAIWDSLSSVNVSNGSLARMVVMKSSNNDPEPNYDMRETEFNAHLINVAQLVAMGVNDPFASGNCASIKPKPHTVNFADDKAEQRWKDLVELQRDMRRAVLDRPEQAFVNRLQENAVKIAIIHAIAENPSDPKLAVHNLDWGLSIAQTSVETLMDAAQNRIADNEEEEFKNLLFRIIQEAGKSGISKRGITRKAQKIDARRRDAMLADMAEAGRIIVVVNKSRKSATYYPVGSV